MSSCDRGVEMVAPGPLERLAAGWGQLRGANSRVCLTRISNFGQTGPYRDYEATSIVIEAMGGPMNATGIKDRAPQRKPGNLALYTVGRFAATASMGNLIWSKRTGRGAVADVAANEVLLSGADRRAAYLPPRPWPRGDAPP